MHKDQPIEIVRAHSKRLLVYGTVFKTASKTISNRDTIFFSRSLKRVR